jgi:hypothetical protein
MFVRGQRADHDLLVRVGYGDFAIRDDSPFRVRNCAGDGAGDVLTETGGAQAKHEQKNGQTLNGDTSHGNPP